MKHHKRDIPPTHIPIEKCDIKKFKRNTIQRIRVFNNAPDQDTPKQIPYYIHCCHCEWTLHKDRQRERDQTMDESQTTPIRVLLICLSGEQKARKGNLHIIRQALDHHPRIELIGVTTLCLAGRLLHDPQIQVAVVHEEDPRSLSLELLIDLVSSTTAKVALHSPRIEDNLAINSLRIGVRGFIPHASTVETIAQAVIQIAAGEIWSSRKLLSDAFTRALPMAAKPASHQTELEELTPREQEIVEHLCSGLSNKEIARELNISDKTVKTHLQRIYRKNQVHSRLQLAVSS